VDCLQGVDLLQKLIKEANEDAIIMALIENTEALKNKIFNLGASDYISSPVIEAELFTRIKSAICLTQFDQQQAYRNNTCQNNTSENKPGFRYSEMPNADQILNQLHPRIDVTHLAERISDACELERDKDNVLVQNTCRYLLANLTVNHSLDQLAHAMATNRNTLSSSFKRVLGKGAFCWLREQRMHKAENLLKTTNLSIQHICYEVGYNDPANFSTAFKAFFKSAPQQYRNK
jgi:AraC-like DNA-binding protein